METVVYKVRDPQGREREIRGPAGASDADVLAQAQKLFGGGNAAAQIEGDAITEGAKNFTDDMSGLDKFMAGAGKAVADTGRGLKQLASFVVPGMDSNAITADIIEARKRDKALMDTGAGMAGDIAGNVAIALLPGASLKGAGAVASKVPMLARTAPALNAAGSALMAPTSIKSAAAVGGGMGLIQPAADATERVTNALIGAGTAAAAQGLTKGLSRVAAPQTRPEVKALIDEGVDLTPGQIVGGAAQRVEDGLTSLPVVGDAIKAAQRRGIESFDTAAINRSLAPIGKSLPKGMKGREAIAFAQQALGDAYDDLLPRMVGALDNAPPANALSGAAGQAAKPTFRQELDVIRKMGTDGLPEAQAGQLGRIIDKEVIGRFTQEGRASGETLKNIESKLGKMAKDFGRSENYDVRTMGDAVEEIRNAMRRMIEDVNPGHGEQLAAVNSGYANFKRIQKAAGAVGAKDGVFTPAQLQSAVKALDRSKDKGRFAVGEALMQDLSEPAKSVLSQTVPDSGTPFRLANLATMGGGYFLDPTVAATTLGAAGAYSRPAQKVVEALLVKRPELIRQLGPKIAAAAPYATGISLATPGVVNASE